MAGEQDGLEPAPPEAVAASIPYQETGKCYARRRHLVKRGVTRSRFSGSRCIESEGENPEMEPL